LVFTILIRFVILHCRWQKSKENKLVWQSSRNKWDKFQVVQTIPMNLLGRKSLFSKGFHDFWVSSPLHKIYYPIYFCLLCPSTFYWWEPDQ